MSNPRTVFAIVEVSEADLPRLQDALADLARHSAAEAGCVQYALHVSVKVPTRIIIHEIWASDTALDLHRQSPHVAEFKRALGGTSTNVWASTFDMLA